MLRAFLATCAFTDSHESLPRRKMADRDLRHGDINNFVAKSGRSLQLHSARAYQGQQHVSEVWARDCRVTPASRRQRPQPGGGRRWRD